MAESLREKVDRLTTNTVKSIMKRYKEDKQFSYTEVEGIVAGAIFQYKEGLAELLKTLPPVK